MFRWLSRRDAKEELLSRLRNPRGGSFILRTLPETEQCAARELVKHGIVIIEGDPQTTSMEESVRLADE